MEEDVEEAVEDVEDVEEAVEDAETFVEIRTAGGRGIKN